MLTTMSSDLDAPPRGPVNAEREPMRYPRYPETPMPEAEDELPENSYWSWSMVFLSASAIIAHTLFLFQMRTDILTVLEFQKELAQQSMQTTPMQWKLVPG